MSKYLSSSAAEDKGISSYPPIFKSDDVSSSLETYTFTYYVQSVTESKAEDKRKKRITRDIYILYFFM